VHNAAEWAGVTFRYEAESGQPLRFDDKYEMESKVTSKNTICLWYNGTAQEAAQFYAKTFPDSSVGAVHRSPGDYPDGKKGDILTVEFTVMGIPCLGLNGGPAFKHNEAFSF
jgi:2-polyprenyl-6-hydroxyphenyl methylase/3-demethylubiquinone-9 3-methyltransferase